MLQFLNCIAQKHDYIWLAGYDSQGVFDSSLYGFKWGQSKLDFNYQPRKVSYDSLGMNFDRTNVAMSDSDGNLLFYSNGIYIANALDEKIENGDSLNEGYYLDVWSPLEREYGYRTPQGILAIPSISNPNMYHLIHGLTDTFPGSNTTRIYCSSILSTLVDMKENLGRGKVLYKNQPIIQDNLSDDLSATRHGNGRDWWILVQKRNTNCYYRILLNENGLESLPDLSCGGDSVFWPDVGSSSFSPDGSKYANFNVEYGLKIFDFDRCSGELSNPIDVPLYIWRDSMWTANGVAFSPNSRFLYVSATKVMLQYDLWAPNIAASVDTLGWYDGYYIIDPSIGSYFYTGQLAPDGKIYFSCGNAINVYHVIHKPDLKGSTCEFEQHGFKMPALSIGVPNYPNYRLGRKVSSECDTIWGGIDEEKISQREKVLKVFPNPATTDVTIDYGFTDWSKHGEVLMELVNELGQVVHQQALPQYSGFQKINVTAYPAGIYTAYIKRNGNTIALSRFAKQ